ncbi:MAG TPA: hypothetical protein VFQ44_20595 [Streptosporangiaceae bacterium]|nr:hypothetical protein [Streptosporangiaceae bacterium]
MLPADSEGGRLATMPGYAENRSALRWPLLTAGLYAPVLGLVSFTGSLMSASPALIWLALGVLFAAVAIWIFGSGMWLRYLWPTGIRLDSDGLRIGGVSWAERHEGRARRRAALVPWQCSQVFSCPWTGVLSIGVTTDPSAVKIMKRYAHRGRKPTPLGNLAAPYMRAALVIWVDESQARTPRIRPATSMWWSNRAGEGYHQPLWIVPTRHPAALSEALGQAPLTSARRQDPRELFRFDPPVAQWASS